MQIFLRASLVSGAKLALLWVRLEPGSLGDPRETRPLDCAGHGPRAGARGDYALARMLWSSPVAPHNPTVCKAVATSVRCPSTRGSLCRCGNCRPEGLRSDRNRAETLLLCLFLLAPSHHLLPTLVG